MDQTSSSTPEGVASNSSSAPKKQTAGKSWLLRLFSFGAVAALAWFFNVHLAVLLASCTLDAFSQGNEKPYLERPDNVRFAQAYQPQALAAWLWVPHPNYQATVAKLTGNAIAKNPDADAAGSRRNWQTWQPTVITPCSEIAASTSLPVCLSHRKTIATQLLHKLPATRKPKLPNY